jgi:hypothetical protein
MWTNSAHGPAGAVPGAQLPVAGSGVAGSVAGLSGRCAGVVPTSPTWTVPFTLPPSSSLIRRAWISPSTTHVAWSSRRLSATDGAGDPTADDGVLGADVPVHHAVLAQDHGLPARTVPSTVPSIRRVPSVWQSPTTRMPGPMMEMTPSRACCVLFVVLLPSILPCGCQSFVQPGCARRSAGPPAGRPCRISKCRCGAVDCPVEPLRAITSFRSTRSPARTKRREAWPYMDSSHPRGRSG